MKALVTGGGGFLGGAIVRRLIERGDEVKEIIRRIRDVFFHPAFPVEIRHNAKIFREKLARWAARRLR